MVREICEAFEVMAAQNPLSSSWKTFTGRCLRSISSRRWHAAVGLAKLVIVGTTDRQMVIISQVR